MNEQQSIFADDSIVNLNYRVKRIVTNEHNKTVTLQRDDMTQTFPTISRHACITEDDQVIYDFETMMLKTKDVTNVDISPKFQTQFEIPFGAKTHILTVREIDNVDDYNAYCSLRQFHYLSNKSLHDKDASLTQAKSSHESDSGRNVVLYAELNIDGNVYSAGYADIGSSLLIHPVRHRLFQKNYYDEEKQLSMTFESNKDNTQVSNRTCRLRRVVIHPDFRSIGLTLPLVRAAMTFAKERYVFGGHTASFFESSAIMFNHIPFVVSAGMHFAGFSLGNRHSVIEHIRLSIRELEQGIDNTNVMAVQNRIRGAKRFMEYCKLAKCSYEDGIKIIERYLNDDTSEFDLEQWAMLRSIVRPLKPYFICGLTDYSDQYIVDALQTSKQTDAEILFSERLKRSKHKTDRNVKINMHNLTVRAKYELPQDRVTESLMNSFGLNGDAVYSNILERIHFIAKSGDVVLVVGGSGCGKSMLLDCLDVDHRQHDNLRIDAHNDADYTVARPRTFDALEMPFNVLAKEYTPDAVFSAFSRMGLAEAFVLVKPFWMLSRGQQYRVMLSELLLRNKDVWIIDEFCADLDAMTANVVSMNLRKAIKRTNSIAILAAANHMHYLDALQPDRVAVMRHGEQIKWRSYSKYKEIQI